METVDELAKRLDWNIGLSYAHKRLKKYSPVFRTADTRNIMAQMDVKT